MVDRRAFLNSSIMLQVCILTATITEIASNTATANILLPVLADTVEKSNNFHVLPNIKIVLFMQAISIHINPIYLMLPATVTCSYAFMLPVATPPNAIVFSQAKMQPLQMVS